VTEPSGERNRIADAATVGAYRFGSLAARMMPGFVAQATASSLGFGVSFASPARRKMIERHLRRVNPGLKGAAYRDVEGATVGALLRVRS